MGALFGEYHSFNADSAYMFSRRQEALARQIGESDLLMNARLNRANILSSTGMYHEVLTITGSIDPSDVPDYLRPYYFHILRTVNGYLADYSAFGPEKEHYRKLTDSYRDSLLKVNDPTSIYHVLIKADQLNAHNRPHEAISLLSDFIRRHNPKEHDKAMCAWTLAVAYGKIGDTAGQKGQLLISAISDITTAIREYISLRELALLLYREGDLDRAYRFMTIAVEDAAKCNARQRIIELNDTYPMINNIYVETVSSQKKNLERTTIVITVMAVILVILLIVMRKQMAKIATGRRHVEEANSKLNDANSRLSESNAKLNELNRQLTDSNEKLNDANNRLVQSNAKLHDAYCSIAEISELKEFYIGRYMDQSLSHIEMLDGYRKSVGKLLSAGKTEELKKFVKSTSLIDDELKLFYERFDKTFLNLFPSFVEDFNNLLLPDEAIVPKKPGTLNPELRIYALIRLGITDSDKIAKFLRYSLTTIYNYRTKVRNKARGDRNQLETEVAKIARQTSARQHPGEA